MDTRFIDPIVGVILAVIGGVLLGVYDNIINGSNRHTKICANLFLAIFFGFCCWMTFGKFKMWRLYGLDGHAWAIHYKREFDLVRSPCKCSGWRARPLPQKLKDMIFEVYE